mmetsp:Transcript_32618/g.74261  ORF Transcript_32618/g.74261 Transcript_32618/m.74261 type:complete len:129 (-) Transcript_32618:153-539(-)
MFPSDLASKRSRQKRLLPIVLLALAVAAALASVALLLAHEFEVIGLGHRRLVGMDCSEMPEACERVEFVGAPSPLGEQNTPEAIAVGKVIGSARAGLTGWDRHQLGLLLAEMGMDDSDMQLLHGFQGY